MTELDAVNLILPYLGEHTVTRVEGSRHGSVGVITSALDRKRKTLLQRKWWFNTFKQTIVPSTDGKIRVPEGTLNVYGNGCNVGLRGGFLYDLSTGSMQFTQPVDVEIVMDFDFDDLPNSASDLIAYDAAIEVTVADLGVEDQIQVLNDYRAKAQKYFERDHLRESKFNSRNAPRRSKRYGMVIGRYR